MSNTPSPHYRHGEGELDSWLTRAEIRSGLRAEDQGLVLAAAATAWGGRPGLAHALEAALRTGAAPERVREAVLQTYLFAGYPRAINALAALATVLPADSGSAPIDPGEDISHQRDWVDQGQALCARIYGRRYSKLLESMGRLSPELGRWMLVEGYGKVLSRPLLEARVRELCAVGALLMMDVPDQMRAHLRGSLLVGATVEELRGALNTAALLDGSHLAEAEALLPAAVTEATEVD